MAQRKKVVIVIGTGHCGSTLLDLILGSHSQAVSLGELVSMNWNGSIGVDGVNWSKVCGVCEDTCAFWPRVISGRVLRRYFSGGGRLQAYIRAVSLYHRSIYDRLFDSTGATVLVDSSKKPKWFQRQLRYPRQWRDKQAYLIYITRDGRAVTNSYFRKYPDRGFEVIVQDWLDRVEELNGYFDSFPPEYRYRIRYEDLASNPGEEADKLCGWLGLPFESSMLRYWRHDHHMIGGNAGTRSLIHRHREQEGTWLSAEVRQRHGEHYDQLGLAIKLDERWRTELMADQISTFHRLAGEVNYSFASRYVHDGL